MKKPQFAIRRMHLTSTGLRLCAVVACIGGASGCSAPPQGGVNSMISVGDNVQVSADVPDEVQWEVVACVDPADARRLLALALIDGGMTETQWLTDGVAYRSMDGGRSWELALDLRGKAGRSIDPACAFGSNGTAYASMMIAHETESPYELALYRSTDGGRTWQAPVMAGASRGIDRPFIAVDNTGGAYDGRVYINGVLTGRSGDGGPARTLPLFRSLDAGASLEAAARVAMPDSTYFASPGRLAVLSDGTVVSLFFETKAWCIGEAGRRVACSPPSPRYVESFRSTDGGETTTQPVTIARVARQPSAMALAVDRTNGPFGGRLYAMWDDSIQTLRRVLLAYSDDGGESWSEATTVSDNVRRPPPDLGPDAFLPALAVSRKGIVGVSWYDERGNPGREHLGPLGYDVRFAASVDGGETFLPSVLVTSPSLAARRSDGESLAASVEPPSAVWGNTALSVSLKGHFLGHTAGLAADSAGVFHPVWVDGRSGIGQVWTAAVTVNGDAARNGSAELAGLDDVTKTVTLELSSIWYSRVDHTISADMRLRNIGPDTVQGPVFVRMLTLSGGIGRVVASNSDNGIGGAGGVWDFSHALKDGVLEPGGVSAAKPLRLTLSDLHLGAPEIARFRGNLVHFNARVLGVRPDAP